VNGVPVSRAVVRMARLGDPAGDEGMRVRGVLDLPAGVPRSFEPTARGAQLAVEDLGSGQHALVDLTSRTAPIPPGAAGTGCGRHDGWRGGVYRNRSNALAPPLCPAGSAHGLKLLRLKDKRATGGGMVFKTVLNGATMAPPVGPLRLTLVLGAAPAAGLAGECGTFAFPAERCRTMGRTYTCR